MSLQGLVLSPHVFVDATNEMSIAQDELFGPVISIIEVRGEDQMLEVANATPYGLSSALIMRDVERGLRFALRPLEVGISPTNVNDSPVNDIATSPFGGEKNSGVGRYNGQVGDRGVHDAASGHGAARAVARYPF